MVIGPWCGSKAPGKKRERAAKLDEAFMEPSASRRGAAVSWTEYVSLRDCATVEAEDGSHFIEKRRSWHFEHIASKQDIGIHCKISINAVISLADRYISYMNKTLFRRH